MNNEELTKLINDGLRSTDPMFQRMCLDQLKEEVHRRANLPTLPDGSATTTPYTDAAMQFALDCDTFDMAFEAGGMELVVYTMQKITMVTLYGDQMAQITGDPITREQALADLRYTAMLKGFPEGKDWGDLPKPDGYDQRVGKGDRQAAADAPLANQHAHDYHIINLN